MTTQKTSALIGPALDWAVAVCNGYSREQATDILYCDSNALSYSTDWKQGGPIIEQEKIEWQWLPSSDKAHQYGARKPSLGGLNRTFCMDGPTVLVAAMRCYVASKLGDIVDIPDNLV